MNFVQIHESDSNSGTEYVNLDLVVSFLFDPDAKSITLLFSDKSRIKVTGDNAVNIFYILYGYKQERETVLD